MALLNAKWLSNFFKQEIPTGTVNGVNSAFTLSATPVFAQAVIVFLDGIVQAQGAHYTISGTTITFSAPPSLGQVPYVFFISR